MGRNEAVTVAQNSIDGESTKSSTTRDRGVHGGVIKALDERFEPKSRRTRYQANFILGGKPSEGWAEYAEDLSELADKAFPTLQDEAKY